MPDPAVRVAYNNVAATSTTSLSFVVSGSPGTVAGDRVFFFFTSRDHTSGTAPATISDDSGDGVPWDLLSMPSGRQTYVWSKVLVGSHDGVTVTASGAVSSCAGVLMYVSDPGAIGSVALEFSASGNEDAAGITPAAANSLILGCIHNLQDDNVASVISWATLGAVTASWFTGSSGGSDSGATAFYKKQVGGPAATGTLTWSQTNNNTIATQIAIAPAAPPAGFPHALAIMA